MTRRDLLETDDVGRSVNSQKNADRALRPRTNNPWNQFMPPVDKRKMSADRLSCDDDLCDVANIADGRAGTFHGWLAVNVEKARALGCRLRATPKPSNNYHVDMKCPLERREQKRLAKDLARAAHWIPDPRQCPLSLLPPNALG